MAALPRKTAVDLDWSRLLSGLSSRCATPMGAQAAADLELLTTADAISSRYAEVKEGMDLLELGDRVPLDGFVDISGYLDRAARHAVLGPEELLELAKAVGASRRLCGFFSERQDVASRLADLCLGRPQTEARSLHDLEELLLSCFEEDGTLSDHASPTLAALRERVRSLRERLSKTIQTLIESYGDVLQDGYFTVREDRYVLPVRTDAHRRVHGIVHGHSGSGQTIYVEPREITSSGNDLVIAQTEVAREEQRVLADLSEEVRLRGEAVTRAMDAIREIDLRVAAARLGADLDGAIPGLCVDEQDRTLILDAVRHPLLVLDRGKVVANDIVLEHGGVLVVSGPNGGGKTVALKTVGLSLLMVRAGLPVPASSSSRLPVVDLVWTDMGDDQSLEQSLSTFAAHMTNIARILDQAKPTDVVLLDELAGGTDPNEGAALATEIAHALSSRGTTVMCTTHYASLKLIALQEPGFTGASLGFDQTQLAPTFRLAPGAPGVSGALAAAGRYGVPDPIIRAARDRMGEETQRLTALMEKLEADRQRAVAQGDKLVEERMALEKARRALDEERAELRARAKEVMDRETQDLLSALRKARHQVRDVEDRLKKRRPLSKGGLAQAKDTLKKVDQDLAPGGKLAKALDQTPLPGRPATEDDIKPGVAVYVTTMRAKGEVVEAPRRKKVKVALGRVTVTAKVEDLRVLEEAPKPKPQPTRTARVLIDAAADPEQPAMIPDNTLDLRGERVDDALREADKFIDRSLEEGREVAFFIHGHGSGALRDALRSHFKGSPYVARHKPATGRQGGEGVTVAWLTF